ncbi:hypothetical protein C8K30_11333 [Promicromonospora sp. AC04]|uniref:hypothetical protein n=1 Tax=Promicromonospora sp. AC04 TaxID=2135723 RepID=UPI000D3385EF|nr:hypothetical protein [Promicromonospora sp. AC04]PUB22165.1 hypothetical protein C8K30_11333 [Promicromonospora sp. AC04]
MSPLLAGAVALATDPSPHPTEGQLRPGLETWQVSPGLIGFLVTFALAVACVLLFLNMSKHLRRAGHNARQQGLPIAEPEGIAFRRTDGDAEFGAAGSAGSTESAGSPESAGSDTDSDTDEGPADGPATSERGGSRG